MYINPKFTHLKASHMASNARSKTSCPAPSCCTNLTTSSRSSPLSFDYEKKGRKGENIKAVRFVYSTR